MMRLHLMVQITTGEEGYASSGGPGSGWRNDGTKGVDFGSNLQDANISFGTVHVCAPLYPCTPTFQESREEYTIWTLLHIS